MFLTKKRAAQQTRDAVAEAMSRVPNLTPQVEVLTQQLADLRAELQGLREDHVGRATDLEIRLNTERETTDTAVTDLRQAVNTVGQAMQEYQPVFDPDGKLDAMRDWVWQMRDWVDNSTERQERKLREMDDLTKYLLEAPPVVRETVIREAAEQVGVRAMYDQHVKPMGVK